MISEEQKKLWSTKEQIPPKNPDAAIPFLNKIAAKQNGSPPFAEESPPVTEESPPAADIGPPLLETTSSPPELIWNIRNEVLTVVITFLILPLVFIACFYKIISPFSLSAHQFLIFFPLLAFSCIFSFILLQLEKGRSLKPVVKLNYYTDASVFQTAQFLYGKQRVIEAAILDLIRRNLLVITRDRMFIVHKDRYRRPTNEENPLITGFINEGRECVTYERIVYTWYKAPDSNQALEYLQSLAHYKERFFIKYHVLLIPFVVAIVRFIQGISTDILVGDLPGEMIGWSIAAVLLMRSISLKAIVKAKVEEKAKIKQKVGLLHRDKIVGEFAMRGKDAISWFSDGIVLAEIFNEPLPIDKASDMVLAFFNSGREIDLFSFETKECSNEIKLY
jgi:hypothetical protein